MVRGNRRTQACAAFAACLLMAVLAAPVEAQFPDFPPPPDSPFWWSLSDEVSSAELREALVNVDSHRQRHFDAVMTGAYQPLTPEEAANLRVFLDGSLWPELIPMALAFDSFADYWEYLPGWDQEVQAQLARYGISAKAIAEITALAADHRLRQDRIMEELRPAKTMMLEILRQADQQPGSKDWHQVAREADWKTLALAAGRSPAELERLGNAWRRSPVQETSAASLRLLRAALSGSDWQRLRDYLREEVAVDIRAIDFQSEPKRDLQ